jgi:hypothetical protein
MTLKQFVEVGAGCVVGFIIYTTNLAPIIKWPLIGVAVALGGMAAFVPFEERPFDHWIITFFRTIYRPTKFFWKREPKIPDFFLYESKNLPQLPVEVDLSPARRQRIHEFITSINQATPSDPYEQYITQRAGEILTSFSYITATQTSVVKKAQKPNLIVRVRDLKPEEKEIKNSSVNPVDNGTGMAKKALGAAQVAANIDVPKVGMVGIQKTIIADTSVANAATNNVNSTAAFVESSPQPIKISNTVEQTVFNTQLPFPSAPTLPNKPVGMVLGPNNELIAGAIVQIITSDGNVVRAVKTNSLGQFFITTPLQSGEYVISAEKNDLSFNQQQLSLTNKILEPIEIKAVVSAQ